MEKIESRQNPLLRHIKKLLSSRSYRYEQGQFAAEGTKLLQEAVRWHAALETVVFEAGVSLPVPEQVRQVAVSREVMQSLSAQKSPQGALFVCRMPAAKPLEMAPGTLILDRIQDPGNLGTILRTADALSVPVVLSDGCADAYSDKTVRASMGAVFRSEPQCAAQQEILEVCRRAQIPLAATVLSASAADIRGVDLSRYAVVIGSEGQGISETYLEKIKTHLIIPMNPRCESLNAAVAATIVMWQMRR